MDERRIRPMPSRPGVNLKPVRATSRRRPFWLPAANYYVLAFAGALALFFLVWGILHEGHEPIPWVPAGIGSSIFLVAAVFLREIVLRKARNRYLLYQQQLDQNLDRAVVHGFAHNAARKMTVTENAELVKAIVEKSDAAKVLMKLSAGHWEVFEMCREYLGVNRRELETAGHGSPRLAGLMRGREIVRGLQKFHLLTWAELESTRLTQIARSRGTISERSATAESALAVIRTALEHYPGERRLIESEAALVEFAATVRISHFVEEAEREAFKGNYEAALNNYKDALYFIGREGGAGRHFERLASQIRTEIKTILEIPTNKNLGIDDDD